MYNRKLFLSIVAATALLAQSPRDAVFNRTLALPGLVTGGWIEAHWMEDGNSFWFAEGGPADSIVYKYDPVRRTKSVVFDVARLRRALTTLAGRELSPGGLPFNSFTFLPGEKSVRFSFEGRDVILRMDSYEIRPDPDNQADRRTPRLLSKPIMVGPPPVYETLSPDGLWFLGVKDGNLYLRSTADSHIEALTNDAVPGYGWDYARPPLWAPDSRALAAVKRDRRNAVLYPILHWLKPTPDVEWVPLENGGVTGEKTERYIIDATTKRQIRIDGDSGFFRGWRPDASELLMTRPGPKKLDFVAVNPKTGATRVLFTETTESFFDLSLSLPNSPNFTPLADNRGFLWLSERDGWNQIYVYDFDGRPIRKLTDDPRPVERVAAVDDQNGWVYYTAHGGEGRPYDFHLYRVNLNGGKAVRLTDAPGKHDQSVYVSYQGARGEGIQFAPSRQFFLDSYSDVNLPPETDLRRADGTLVEVLSKANVDAAMALRPIPPEEFSAKAADRQTDLYGVLYKPYDFDASKKYPVVDFIYAGPQMTRVPRSFAGAAREQAFANLGILFLVVDARGTPERGKAFQDVVYRNIGRYEIPDHVAVLKQLSAARPYIDMSRVGVFGGSFGGYFAVRALLQAPDIFQVGVAMAPINDLSKGGYATWMGPPEENQEGYDFASNLRMAANLKGHLLLIHGTSDVNAPFAETIRMIDALERAGKPYDLVLLPEQGHAAQNSIYSLQAVKRYLVEHLKP